MNVRKELLAAGMPPERVEETMAGWTLVALELPEPTEIEYFDIIDCVQVTKLGGPGMTFNFGYDWGKGGGQYNGYFLVVDFGKEYANTVRESDLEVFKTLINPLLTELSAKGAPIDDSPIA